MKKLVKALKVITAVIAALSAVNAGIAFIAERIGELKEYGRELRHKPYGVYERFVKRPLDCFLSTGALIVLSPVLAATAFLVRKKLGSPVLFTQERPGKDEKIFKLYKFRTMTDERDENGELLPDEVRLTKFGRLLRSSSIDELPELFNIVKGDMALIGPRPLLKEYLPWYTSKEHRRHEIRSGLTGWAQVNGRNNLDWDRRFEIDVYYVDNISFKFDLKIFALTIKKVFSHEDVAENTREVEPNFADQRRRLNSR